MIKNKENHTEMLYSINDISNALLFVNEKEFIQALQIGDDDALKELLLSALN